MGVEKYNAGTPLVLDQLHGTWLLQYTTASEIVSLIQAADQFPLLQVGQLYQCFDCQGRTDGGTVENIVRWSVSGLLQKNEGATFNVVAKFAMVGPRIIVIQKVEARLGEVKSRIGVIHCSSTFTSNFHQLPGVLLRISLVTMSFDINQFHSHVHFVVVIS
ncbi:probable plastid-lipid-associated protein 10, chloroplastic isoform X3 [Physcomitrium patens]|nr:probable plastid-lipid-associated protein 10, chloroplastic isoform X3 [Physcomitrium patens]|eukprot:XP_024402929.1 probable plastid-lipid-associated protein 10, chloroplastic isoform X3 [Physcomitrella patens]